MNYSIICPPVMTWQRSEARVGLKSVLGQLCFILLFPLAEDIAVIMFLVLVFEVEFFLDKISINIS